VHSSDRTLDARGVRQPVGRRSDVEGASSWRQPAPCTAASRSARVPGLLPARRCPRPDETGRGGRYRGSPAVEVGREMLAGSDTAAERDRLPRVGFRKRPAQSLLPDDAAEPRKPALAVAMHEPLHIVCSVAKNRGPSMLPRDEARTAGAPCSGADRALSGREERLTGVAASHAASEARSRTPSASRRAVRRPACAASE
jgi:hypothetical protein